MSRWTDAHVGVDSVGMTLRVTEEEKQRLEQLRRQQGLTSKAQVIRFALDLLEVLNTPNEFLIGGPERVKRAWKEHPELVELAVKKWAAGPDAEDGSPGPAPESGQGKQEA